MTLLIILAGTCLMYFLTLGIIAITYKLSD